METLEKIYRDLFKEECDGSLYELEVEYLKDLSS